MTNYRSYCRKCLGLLMLGIAMLVLVPSQAIAQTIPLEQSASANVLYLGEQHDRAEDHVQELDILQQLYQCSPKLVIGLEMFQRPYQTILDQYLSGEINAEELRAQSEFDRRWGYDWDDYAPILAFARSKHLPIRALNTPTEVTWKVGEHGVESLQGEDWRWIPSINSLDLSNPSYRDRIQATYESFHQGTGNSTSFEHFYQAQSLWDETMAEAIAAYVNAHPDQLFITLVGSGHVASDEGIPNRVKRRIQFPNFKQYSWQLSADEN